MRNVRQTVTTTAAVGCGLIGLLWLAASLRRDRHRKREIAHLTYLLRRQEEELQARKAKITELGIQVASEGRQRTEERRGRTEAERRLRAEKQEIDETNGYNFTAIGTASTPFRDRRGTPRQGSITPLSRGKVSFDSSVVGYPALIGLADFSHVWLLFVFHDNTNAMVNGMAAERPVDSEASSSTADASAVGATNDSVEGREGGRREEGGGRDDAERWGGGAREYQPHKHKLRQTFLTKVCPPRLGKKVGVLGTRSPHRPNPLGLTMVKLDGVNLKTNSITVSGIDLVDGTPIVDIKPVIPHDVPPDMRFPQWVEEDPCYRRVVFADAASEGLRRCVGEEARRSKSKFYGDVESFKAALTQIIIQDVRSVHQGRGLASDELYECCFDGVVMHFVTTEDEMRVVSAK